MGVSGAGSGGGYFSSDPAVNPLMYNWNKVYMRYCDGNSFSGSNASVTVYKNTTLHWRGKHILKVAALKRTQTRHAELSASEMSDAQSMMPTQDIVLRRV